MSLPATSPTWRDRFAASGVALMVASVLVAPMIDVFAKLASARMPAVEITLGRFVVQAALMLPFAMARGPLFSRSPGHAAIHALRGLILAIGMIAFVYALKFMPIADAIAIFFVEPALLTLMSGLFLRETIGWRKIVACVTGFAGSLLIIQPSFSDFGTVALLPLVTAISVATFLLLTRALAHVEDPWSMQFQSSFWAVAISAVILILGEGSGSDIIDPAMPDGLSLVHMAGVGVAASLSGILGAYAYRAAPASLLAPLQYLEIVSAASVAYIVFGDFPNALKWVGIVIIIASGVFIILTGDKRARPAPDAAI